MSSIPATIAFKTKAVRNVLVDAVVALAMSLESNLDDEVELQEPLDIGSRGTQKDRRGRGILWYVDSPLN